VASLYRIVTEEEWGIAEREGVFRGAPHDQRDGFVHLSAPSQVEGTLALHYAGVPGLVLLTIDGDRLASQHALKWEPSRGGELFPHLYEPLRVALVTGISQLPLDASGKHVLPAELRARSVAR
jgi:uncharacterized protein (DUF952 family)